MAEEGSTGTGETQETGQQGGTGGEDVSGLKSALEKVRAELKEAKGAAKRTAELEQKLAQYEEATKTETEKAIEAARLEGAESERATLTAARVLDKIEVRAAGKFADPEDAQLRLKERAGDFVGKDGAIDTDAIDKALTELLEAKPHLAAGDGKRFPGTADQGPRKPADPALDTPGARIRAGLAQKN